MRTEIGDSWIGHVLFNFRDTEYMMVRLTALPMATISKIRHLRVLGTILPQNERPVPDNQSESDYDYTYYTLVHALKLLPGLQLDTLTVLTPIDKYCDYEVLDTLIKYGEGWKELRFICQHSAQLGYKFPDSIRIWNNTVGYSREPQPAHWVNVMNTRDGIQNQPSVTMYRSTLPGKACSVMTEATRVLVKQTPSEEEENPAAILEYYGRNADRRNVKYAQEFMVVVKRGKGIDYQEKEDSDYLPPEIGDVREDIANKTLEEIQEEYLCWWCKDAKHYSNYGERLFFDRYEHVDEYIWRELERVLAAP